MKRYEIYQENPLKKVGEKNNFGNALAFASDKNCIVHDTQEDKWYRPI